jgi:hypothetical protein
LAGVVQEERRKAERKAFQKRMKKLGFAVGWITVDIPKARAPETPT